MQRTHQLPHFREGGREKRGEEKRERESEREEEGLDSIH